MTRRPDPFILAFGDSLTAGYGLAPGDAFPAQLQALLRHDARDAVVQNAGISGDTTVSALARLPTVLAKLSQRPDLTIVELGANDLIRRISPQRTLAALDAILTELQRCCIPILLATVEPPAMLSSLGAAYSNIYTIIAERHDVPTHPFFPAGVMGHHDHVLRDRFHPNAEAIRRVAQAMLPVVRSLLSR